MIKMWNLRFCLETACNRLTLRSPAQGKRKDGNFCKRNASNAVVIFLRRGNFPALRNSNNAFDDIGTDWRRVQTPRLPHKSQSQKG